MESVRTVPPMWLLFLLHCSYVYTSLWSTDSTCIFSKAFMTDNLSKFWLYHWFLLEWTWSSEADDAMHGHATFNAEHLWFVKYFKILFDISKEQTTSKYKWNISHLRQYCILIVLHSYTKLLMETLMNMLMILSVYM